MKGGDFKLVVWRKERNVEQKEKIRKRNKEEKVGGREDREIEDMRKTRIRRKGKKKRKDRSKCNKKE